MSGDLIIYIPYKGIMLRYKGYVWGAVPFSGGKNMAAYKHIRGVFIICDISLRAKV